MWRTKLIALNNKHIQVAMKRQAQASRIFDTFFAYKKCSEHEGRAYLEEVTLKREMGLLSKGMKLKCVDWEYTTGKCKMFKGAMIYTAKIEPMVTCISGELDGDEEGPFIGLISYAPTTSPETWTTTSQTVASPFGAFLRAIGPVNKHKVELFERMHETILRIAADSLKLSMKKANGERDLHLMMFVKRAADGSVKITAKGRDCPPARATIPGKFVEGSEFKQVATALQIQLDCEMSISREFDMKNHPIPIVFEYQRQEDRWDFFMSRSAFQERKALDE